MIDSVSHDRMKKLAGTHFELLAESKAAADVFVLCHLEPVFPLESSEYCIT